MTGPDGAELVRDCLRRAQHARGRQSQLAWMEHAEHAARKLHSVGRWRGFELADRLDYLRRFYEPSALPAELSVLRHEVR